MAKKSPPKLYQRLMLVTYKPEFIEDIKNLRIECGIPVDGIRIEDIGDSKVSIDLEMLDVELKKLRVRYKLQEIYQGPLASYVQFGFIDKRLFANENAILRVMSPQKDSDWPYVRLMVEILPETTSDDLIALFPQIAMYQEAVFKRDLGGRDNEMPALERNLRMVELRREGMTGADIAKTVKDEFPDMPIDYNNVYKVVKNTENLISAA